jgi:hypothetical protein
MDEIEKRLKETSEICFNCYEAWRKDAKDTAAREALLEAIHEIRKVASRLEIELAISERDEMKQRPIPIPPHRDARRRAPEHDDDSMGNSAEPDTHQQGGGGQRPQLQRRSRPHGGGGDRGPRREGGGQQG